MSINAIQDDWSLFQDSKRLSCMLVVNSACMCQAQHDPTSCPARQSPGISMTVL